MWFRKKKISVTVKDMRHLTEMIEHYDIKIKQLDKFKKMLCPRSSYGYSNALLAEAIDEKICHLEEQKLDI